MGSLTVLTQLACEAHLAFTVPPGAFRPPPQVDSAVLHSACAPGAPAWRPRTPPRFREVVLAAFGQRRKNLGQSPWRPASASVPTVPEPLCADADVDPGRRAETLSFSTSSPAPSPSPPRATDRAVVTRDGIHHQTLAFRHGDIGEAR